MSRPFCANTRCFMHALEVEDEVQRVQIGLPNGGSREMTRDYMLVKHLNRRFPFCDTCSNVGRIIMDEGRDMPPSFGMKVESSLIGPDGEVLSSDTMSVPNFSEPKIIQ